MPRSACSRSMQVKIETKTFPWQAALAVVVLAGCAAGTLALSGSHHGQTPGSAALQIDVARTSSTSGAGPADADYGSVQVAVRWPSASLRSVQTIPLSATSIALSLATGSTTVATASIPLPATSSTLAKIPVGSYTLTAEALRSDGSDAASASATLDVVANRVAQASLSLIPLDGPSLSGISPMSGPPGGQIDINGTNLAPPANGTYSVLVDGQAVPSNQLQGGASTIYLIGMPSWAQSSGTATISVSVDGVTAPQTEIYTVQNVQCVTLTPQASTDTSSTTVQFSATAYGDQGCSQAISGIPFSWNLTNQDPVPSTMPGATPSFTLSGSGVFQTYVSTGSAWIWVTGGGVTATTSITASVSTAILDATPAPGGGAAGM